VTTVEGLEQNGKLNRLQESFIDNFAPQCGYCTSAMLLAGQALLEKNPHPTDAEVRTALAGILCRCTGYTPYIKAIMEASTKP
jgi:carbon-monoxide dehydrogenase small subunit